MERTFNKKMMDLVFIVLTTLSCSFNLFECSLRCMKCNNIPLPRVCTTVETCGVDEICYVEKNNLQGHTLYNSGCKHKGECLGIAVVGKRDTVSWTTNPLECCQTSFCNKEGFSLRDIPKSVRGPHCFTGSYAFDVTQTKQLTTCAINEVCTTQAVTFDGVNDVFYSQTCIEKSACSSIQPYTGCDGSCCENDFCNDRCEQYTTPSPTLDYTEILKTECLKHINDGYFFDSYSNLCILVVKSPALIDRDHADRACTATTGELVSITSQDEQDFLLSWIFSHQENDTDFWIGAKVKVSKSHDYYWPDGSPANEPGSYNHWSGVMMGQPDDRRTKNENCVFLNNKDRYFWHDDKCTEKKTGYICEIWNVTGDKIPHCRRKVFDGFFYDANNDICIQFIESGLPQFTHTAAKAECSAHGATLAIVDSSDKMDFILRWIFSNHENATDFWIGAEDVYNKSEFYWPNGQILSYTHWGNPVFPPEPHGQPDAAYGVTDQRCVYMDYKLSYFWFDEVCAAQKSGFICQYNGTDHETTKLECRRRLVQGYFYDDFTNMCITIKTHQRANYQQAHGACVTERSELAVIDSQDKMDFVLTWIFYQKINDTDYWIGGRDVLGDNNFVWEPTGMKFTYIHWYTVTPPRPEDCAILDHIDVYRWKMADCKSRINGYICEINQHTLGRS